tara:strand:+ start:88946 stop:90040 length:1095 start_codon:yes stop_codon:yes gene_type:complete
MIRRSIKVLTAAAILGISPALLSAQLPIESPDAGLKSKVGSESQVQPKSDVTDNPVERVQKGQGTKTELDARNKLDADSKLDANGTKLDSGVDAKTKARGSVNTPGVTPPALDKNAAPVAPKANPADGAINKLPQNTRPQAQDRLQNNVDNLNRQNGNRPFRDGVPQTFEGQGNVEIDAMVRQGTAHLDIDDATRARYRHHNGHWWYKTEDGQWLIDNNGQWEEFDPVTYRNQGPQMDQDYYQDQQGVDGDYQSNSDFDDNYYYDNNSYGNGYGNGGYYNRGNGYYGNRYFNNGNGYYGRGYNRGYNNHGYYNNGNRNNGRWSSGYRGNSNRRQGAGIGAGIGGAIGGNRGAAIGAGIGAEIAD